MDKHITYPRLVVGQWVAQLAPPYDSGRCEHWVSSVTTALIVSEALFKSDYLHKPLVVLFFTPLGNSL